MTATSMKFGSKDYSFVPARLKQFREDNPRADIQSKPTWNPDGSCDFMTRITKDRAEENSAMGTGWAHYSKEEMAKVKAFEKLETISKGRALADIGYLNDGQIATTEEMDEFNQFKQDKVQDAISLLESAESLDELKSTFMKLGTLMKHADVVTAKDKMKVQFSKVAV